MEKTSVAASLPLIMQAFVVKAFAASILILFTGRIAMADEESAFTLILEENAFQVTQYPPLVSPKRRLRATGNRPRALASASFLGIFFSGNTRREGIAMAAPVMWSPVSEKIAKTAPVSQTAIVGAWVIQFMMPPDKTLDALPKPNDLRIVLHVTPAIRVAVIRLSGWASDRDFERMHAELERWMAKRGLHATGPASLAQYDPPWTPGQLRRDQVILPVDAATPH